MIQVAIVAMSHDVPCTHTIVVIYRDSAWVSISGSVGLCYSLIRAWTSKCVSD